MEYNIDETISDYDEEDVDNGKVEVIKDLRMSPTCGSNSYSNTCDLCDLYHVISTQTKAAKKFSAQSIYNTPRDQARDEN